MIGTLEREQRIAALAVRLAPLEGRSRRLALEIVGYLISVFAIHIASAEYNSRVQQVTTLAAKVTAAKNDEERGALCIEADHLASMLYSRVGPRGTWPLELQIPYDLATATRRACEEQIWRFLPLVVYEAERMLERARVPVGPLREVVERALREAS